MKNAKNFREIELIDQDPAKIVSAGNKRGIIMIVQEDEEDSLFNLYYKVDTALAENEREKALVLLDVLRQKCDTATLIGNLIDYLCKHADIALDRDEDELSLALVRLAETLSEKEKIREKAAVIHEIQGRVLCRQRLENQAFFQFNRAGELAAENGQIDLLADSLHGLGVVCHALDRNEEAEGYLKKAETLYGQQGRHKKQGYSLYMLGANALDTARPVEALLYQEKATTLLIKEDDWVEVARNWSEQSMTLLYMGQYSMALEKNTQALSLYEKYGLSPEMTLSIQSEILSMLGRLQEALETLDKAAEIYTGTGSTRLMPLFAHNRGSLLFHLKDIEGSVCSLSKAAVLYEEQGLKPEEAYTRFLLAMVLHLTGNMEAANEEWQKAGVKIYGQKQEYWQNMTILRQVLIISERCKSTDEKSDLFQRIIDAAKEYGFIELGELLKQGKP